MVTLKSKIRGLAPLEIEAYEVFDWIKKIPQDFKLLMRFGRNGSKRYFKYFYTFRNGVYYLRKETRPILNLEYERLRDELNRESDVPFAGLL